MPDKPMVIMAPASGKELGHYLAEIVVRVMRGVVTGSQPSSFEAVETLKYFFERVAQHDGDVRLYDIIDSAISELRGPVWKARECDQDERRYTEVAMDGTRYLLELTGDHGLARARQQKALENLRHAVEYAEDARLRRRRAP